MFTKTDNLVHALRGVEAIDPSRTLCLVRGHRNAQRPRWFVKRYNAAEHRAAYEHESAERYMLRSPDVDSAIDRLNSDPRTMRAVATLFGS